MKEPRWSRKTHKKITCSDDIDDDVCGDGANGDGANVTCKKGKGKKGKGKRFAMRKGHNEEVHILDELGASRAPVISCSSQKPCSTEQEDHEVCTVDPTKLRSLKRPRAYCICGGVCCTCCGFIFCMVSIMLVMLGTASPTDYLIGETMLSHHVSVMPTVPPLPDLW